jgi:fructan beta-fructosidase
MNKIHYGFFSFLLILYSCYDKRISSDKDLYKSESSALPEAYRPIYHFTPEENWMNDPNGMVYYEGEYHLFYQYYPEDIVWGPMHWGHAVSEDMVSWEHLPIALYPDSLGLIFSGSAVIDWKNTTGFGNDSIPPMVAIFTHHSLAKEKEGRDDYQYQSIAYSLDKGRTWQKYEGNPVIPNPGIRDFRDPKVIWQ